MGSGMLGFQKFWPQFYKKHKDNILSGLGASAVVTVCTVYLIPQSLLLDRCVKWFQLYEDGSPADLPKSLEEKGRKVLEATNLTDKKKSMINFFSVYGFDVYHLGTTRTKQGVCLGIPKNYIYEKPSDVEQHTISLDRGVLIQWFTSAAQNLQEALVLSNNAQKFGIAREIYASDFPRLQMFGMGTSVVMFAVMAASKLGNTKLNLLQRDFKWRATWYTLCSIFGACCWVMIKDAATLVMDKKSDEKAADMGLDYVKGGIEYYEKKMLLNRSLRVLMGSKGENLFSATGNYNTLFRTRTLPLSNKLDTLKARLQEMQKETQEPTPFEV